MSEISETSDSDDRNDSSDRRGLTVAILAGGESRRMGRDKALLPAPNAESLSWLERTANVAKAAGLPVCVIGRERPAVWKDTETVFLKDDASGLGPAGGLATALQYAQGPVLLLPCDLPQLTTNAITWLTQQFHQTRANAGSEYAGIVASNMGQIEPLFAVYMPASLPLLRERLSQNRRSLQGLIEVLAEAGHFVRTPLPQLFSADLCNINTPEEWASVREGKKNRSL